MLLLCLLLAFAVACPFPPQFFGPKVFDTSPAFRLRAIAKEMAGQQPSRPWKLGVFENKILQKALLTNSLVGDAAWDMGLELLDTLQVSVFPPNIINYFYGSRGSGFVPLLAQMAMLWNVDLRKQFRALFVCMSENVGVRQAGVTISVCACQEIRLANNKNGTGCKRVRFRKLQKITFLAQMEV